MASRPTDKSALKQVTELQNLTHAELRQRWRTLIGGDPPAYNRTFIMKHLAYRLQELHYGGLSERARSVMTDALRCGGFDEDGRMLGSRRTERDRKRMSSMPVIGTRLMREWNGRRYEAIVVPGGFEYDGRKHRSLTAVALAITGTHWNGRAFFGLKSPDQKGRSAR